MPFPKALGVSEPPVHLKLASHRAPRLSALPEVRSALKPWPKDSRANSQFKERKGRPRRPPRAGGHGHDEGEHSSLCSTMHMPRCVDDSLPCEGRVDRGEMVEEARNACECCFEGMANVTLLKTPCQWRHGHCAEPRFLKAGMIQRGGVVRNMCNRRNWHLLLRPPSAARGQNRVKSLARWEE